MTRLAVIGKDLHVHIQVSGGALFLSCVPYVMPGVNPTNQIVTRPLATDENPDFPRRKKNTPSVVSLKRVKNGTATDKRIFFRTSGR